MQQTCYMLCFSHHSCTWESPPHNFFPPPRIRNSTGEPRGSNCATPLLASPLHKSSFQVPDCLSFHPRCENHPPLPLFSHSFPLPLVVIWMGWLRRYCSRIPPAPFLSSPLLSPFFRNKWAKKFSSPVLASEHDFRRVQRWLFHQHSGKAKLCSLSLKERLL